MEQIAIPDTPLKLRAAAEDAATFIPLTESKIHLKSSKHCAARKCTSACLSHDQCRLQMGIVQL